MLTISPHDKDILRNLAKKQMECAHSETNLQNMADWKLHNACRGRRPMIHLELGTFAEEVIPRRLKCEGETARRLEWQLYDGFLNHDLFMDDRPVNDYFPVYWAIGFIPFGISIEAVYAKDREGRGLGHRFLHAINDLEDDFHKLGESRYGVDREATQRQLDLAADIFGDILIPKLTGYGLVSSPTQAIVHIMGMERMFISMYDCPGLFHEMMDRYTADTLASFNYMERERLLLPTIGAENLDQGSWCFTGELPESPQTTLDVWGYMDSQETVGVSPKMFGEFFFPYYKRIAQRMGLLSYGCCEPIHPIWDNYIETLGNVRKASISAWCDEGYMGERLRECNRDGRKIIYHRKPNPNFLGVGAVLDEEGLRLHIRDTLTAAKGCPLEITQRDVYTINHDEAKARRYIEIIRDEIEKHWQQTALGQGFRQVV